MKRKIKKIFTSVRVIILLICLILAVAAIRPSPWNDGAAIRTIITNSSAHIGGLQSPKPNAPPMSREVIQFVNNKQIENIDDYEQAIENLRINTSVQIRTNMGTYRLLTRESFNVTELNETELIEVEETRQVNKTINGTPTIVNETVKIQKEVPKTLSTSLGLDDIGIRTYNAPKSNIRRGLDLAGGTRVLLQPEKKLSELDLDNLIAVMQERLNIYGLTDLVITEASDLSDNQYIITEIAGATTEEVRDLLAKQGKFEARIGKATVFKGGEDITYVCRSPDCAPA